jgi:hypothetical protein
MIERRDFGVTTIPLISIQLYRSRRNICHGRMSEVFFQIRKYHSKFVIVIVNVLGKFRDPNRDRDQSCVKSVIVTVIVFGRRKIFVNVIEKHIEVFFVTVIVIKNIDHAVH